MIDKQADRKVKTKGPKIVSNDIHYIYTVVIGGTISLQKCTRYTVVNIIRYLMECDNNFVFSCNVIDMG